jgi:hypothetical protein
VSYGRIERGPMAADNFTQISNGLFRDPRLSAKAKGIFGFISTHRAGWGLTPESIAAAMKDGVSAIKAGLQELERFGYLVRSQPRKSDGTMGSGVYRITDIPSSQPVVENRPADVTCENVAEEGSDESLRRSEPVDENPPAADPPAADRPHKKTIPQNINEKKTTSSSRPSIQLVPELAEDLGGGGNAPQQQDKDLVRAAGFVDSLPYGGRLPGPKQRAALVQGVAAAFAGGWTDVQLHKQLTEETSTAKSLSAVYRHRLAPENLPAAPATSAPVPGQRHSLVVDHSAGKRPECDGCGRYIPTGSTSTVCIDCRPDAAYA